MMKQTRKKRKAKLFEFKSKYHPGQLKKIDNFEKGLVQYSHLFQIQKIKCDFQEKMKSDILDDKSSPNVIICR